MQNPLLEGWPDYGYDGNATSVRLNSEVSHFRGYSFGSDATGVNDKLEYTSFYNGRIESVEDMQIIRVAKRNEPYTRSQVFGRALFVLAVVTTIVMLMLALLTYPGGNGAIPSSSTQIMPLSDDVLRPQFHLLPPENWMNDPCGTTFQVIEAVPNDIGLFHMYYQCNPDAAEWGNIHWCHATSPDTIFWTNQPISLAPGAQSPGSFPPQRGAALAVGADGFWEDTTFSSDETNDYSSYQFDTMGVFSGSLIIGGIVNDSLVGQSSGDGQMASIPQATIFYTGVSVPYNVSDVNRNNTITLKDGKHPWVEVQAAAVSYDPQLSTWTKHISAQIPVDNQTSEVVQLNPLLPTPPSPFTALEISGFRDPAVTVMRDQFGSPRYQMLVGSGFMSNLTAGITGGGAVFAYESANLTKWAFQGLLFQANHTMQYAESMTASGYIDPVDMDEMWECPDSFELPVINAPEMGNFTVLLFGSQRKVVYHVGVLVPVAETSCVGEENFMYPRGNLTFVTYISGIVDYGYYYAARTQAAVDNFHVNNLNPFNNGTKPTTSAYGVPYTGSNSRLLWGWLPEGSSQSVQQNIAQGWAGVMSLPRLLTLEYHEGSNTLATGSTFTQQSSQNFMYNSEYYLTPTQQQSRAHIAPSLNLVIAPAPAIEYLRVVKEAAGGESSSPTTLSFGDYSTSQEAVEALYESAGINKLSGDIVLTANTTIAPLTLQIVDAQNNVFASVSLQQTGGGNETLQQTLTVNGIACNCSSLFGFNTPAPINATQKADYNFYAANTPLQLRIILDASVIEVFVNGRCTLTQRVYQSHFEVWPKQSQRDLLKLRLLNTAGLSSVQTVQVWQMIPISSNRMTNIPPVGKSFSVD